MTSAPVTLGDADDGLSDLARRARAAAPPPDAVDASTALTPALELARALGRELPPPATGRTLRLWASLASIGAQDLTVARVVEPHLDALAILDEATRAGHAVPGDGLSASDPEGGVWGVYAAEGGGDRLLAHRADGSWSLTGPKPWCSLGDLVTHALVTAWVDEDSRALFAVDLTHPGVRPAPGGPDWVSRGLTWVRSTGLHLDHVPAHPVGEPGWYLQRPGFAWGGIGVAAIWFGGAVGVARRLRDAALRRQPDQLQLAALGSVDVALTRARATLRDAAEVVDGPRVSADQAGRLALRVRGVVADTVEAVLAATGRALGPGPLALEEDHARRVADLTVYVRQHHGERDAAALGGSLLSAETGYRGGDDEHDGADWSWW